jgi:iron complex outermembrane receptor protein
MRGCFITALCLMALTTWTGSAPLAVDDEEAQSPPRYQLDLIITTAERRSEEFFYTVDELPGEELREGDLLTLAQALNYLPGIRTAVARVGHGQYVYLRGFEQQHLLILVDGVPLYNPYDGLVELDHIPSEQIMAIKVVKGPSSATYGPNALGGVIHIITKNFQNTLNRGLVAEFGQDGTSNLRLHHAFHRGPLYIRVSGSRARSDGYRLSGDFQETEIPILPDGQDLLHYENGGLRENSDHAKNAGHLALGYVPSERFHLAFYGSLVDNEWGVPPHPFYNAEQNKTRIRYWRFNEWRQGMAHLTATYRQREGLSARAGIFLNTYDNTLDGYDDEHYSSQEMGYAFHSVYDDHALGGHLLLENRLGRMGNLTVAGGVIQDIHRDKPNLGEPIKEFESRTWWVSVEDKLRFSERISWVLGLNYALQEKRKAGGLTTVGDDSATLNPHISLACLTSRGSRIYLSLAHLTRFATMKQLFGDGGNPKLKAQKTTHVELGGEWALFPETRLRGVLFYDGIRDFIEGNFLSRTTVNVEKARFLGSEVTLQSTPLRGLRIILGYSYLRAENRSLQRPGRFLQYRPEHELDWRLTMALPYALKVLFHGSALSRQYFYNDFQERQLSHLPSYALCHLTLRRALGSQLEAFLTASNIFDAAYQEVYTSPAPGRQARLGCQLNW